MKKLIILAILAIICFQLEARTKKFKSYHEAEAFFDSLDKDCRKNIHPGLGGDYWYVDYEC